MKTSEELSLLIKSSQGKTETAGEEGEARRQAMLRMLNMRRNLRELWRATVWGPAAEPTLLRSVSEQMARDCERGYLFT